MSVGVRKTGDHVDGDVRPWSFRDGVRVKWHCLGLRARLRVEDAGLVS